MEQYFIRWRGKMTGPYSRDQLIALARSGQITKHHSISSDGQTWSMASSLEWLFPKAPERPAPAAQPVSPATPARDQSAASVTEDFQPAIPLAPEPHAAPIPVRSEFFLAGSSEPADAPHAEPSGTAWWVGIGIAFIVFYFMPLLAVEGRVMFAWDLFSDEETVPVAIFATYVFLLGLALPILGTQVTGTGRSIAVLSLGLFGVFGVALPIAALSFGVIPETYQRTLPDHYRIILACVLTFTILFALVGNCLRSRYPDAVLPRVISGATGGSLIFLLLLHALLSLAHHAAVPAVLHSDSTVRGVATFMVVLSWVGDLLLLVSGVLLVVNARPHGSVQGVAYSAGLLTRLGLELPLYCILVFTVLAIDEAVPASTPQWWAPFFYGLLLLVRILGVFLGFYLMIGIGFMHLMEATVLKPVARPA